MKRFLLQASSSRMITTATFREPLQTTRDTKPELVLDKDIYHMDIRTDGNWAVTDNKRMYLTDDGGKSWRPAKITGELQLPAEQLNAVQSTQKLPFHKFIMDLHTGKAFFGKALNGVWIFLTGLSVCVLTFTGIYMWYVKQRKRKKY